MATPPITSTMNHSGINLEDLDDYLLTQILLRLPSCATVRVCSLVNKRWCSLISAPKFPDQFANHKKSTNLFIGSESDIDEPPWTIVKTMETTRGPDDDNVIHTIRLMTEFIVGSPKLSLEYLPCQIFTPRDTFKDLVLCSDCGTHPGGGRVYYITNPLTKQWVALPLCPGVKDGHYQTQIRSSVLICEEPLFNQTQDDYKFRVVEVRHPRMDPSIDKLELVVYFSEIGEWKEINLRIPKEVGSLSVNTEEPETVVCNGILYFKSGLCLVALDPFDVDDTCDVTIEARVMPPLPKFGYLQESSGHLLAVCTLKGNNVPSLWYEIDVTATIELGMVVWKLDPNQVPLQWETTFQGLCKGIVNCIDIYTTIWNSNTRLERHITTKGIGVHPYNDKLIYMYLAPTKQVVLCDTRTGCITSSEDLSYDVVRFHRLEQQWWPTSVPSLVQCLTVKQN